MSCDGSETPIGDAFIIEWDDGTFTTADEKRVGEMFDMADCDAMDRVRRVLAVGRDGNLQTVQPTRKPRRSGNNTGRFGIIPDH